MVANPGPNCYDLNVTEIVPGERTMVCARRACVPRFKVSELSELYKQYESFSWCKPGRKIYLVLVTIFLSYFRQKIVPLE